VFERGLFGDAHFQQTLANLLWMYLLGQLVSYEFNDFSICHHIENSVAGENEELKFFLLTDYHIWYRCHNLLVKWTVDILLEEEVPQCPRHGQSSVDSVEFDPPTARFDTLQFIPPVWFVVEAQWTDMTSY
jgi:hypothetical protein